jgi:photoactive yellow protein
MAWAFDAPDLLDVLEDADDAALDAAPFGVISMTPEGVVTHYNTSESQLSGLSPARVVGRIFFTGVAPCTNNFMVAHRFQHEPELDATIDYVFTTRMTPTPVRLRMLRQTGRRGMYLIVERR